MRDFNELTCTQLIGCSAECTIDVVEEWYQKIKTEEHLIKDKFIFFFEIGCTQDFKDRVVIS